MDRSSAVTEDVIHEFIQQETGHLTLPHLNYFSHWLLLCCLESVTMETRNSRKRVWLQTVEERYEARPSNNRYAKSLWFYQDVELKFTREEGKANRDSKLALSA